MGGLSCTWDWKATRLNLSAIVVVEIQYNFHSDASRSYVQPREQIFSEFMSQGNVLICFFWKSLSLWRSRNDWKKENECLGEGKRTRRNNNKHKEHFLFLLSSTIFSRRMATSTEKTKTAQRICSLSRRLILSFVLWVIRDKVLLLFGGWKLKIFSGKIMFALHAKFSVFNVCQKHTHGLCCRHSNYFLAESDR
jgi:hypothetical protein